MGRGRGRPLRRPVTWYKKLVARALMLGVNYGQGWLALQGIKRAARERDENLPKFPLFRFFGGDIYVRYLISFLMSLQSFRC